MPEAQENLVLLTYLIVDFFPGFTEQPLRRTSVRLVDGKLDLRTQERSPDDGLVQCNCACK